MMHAPTHLLADAGDRRALCGSLELPRTLLRHYDAHRVGYGREACPECATIAETAPVGTPVPDDPVETQGTLW